MQLIISINPKENLKKRVRLKKVIWENDRAIAELSLMYIYIKILKESIFKLKKDDAKISNSRWLNRWFEASI
jgi:hypothetical protein